MLMLQWAGQFGFAELLNQLESLGFFKYVLPFLLIFALVYAILTKIDIFGQNKGAGVIIALAVGLLALQLDFVPAFFQNVFPKFGIGLAFLLIALILAGAFISGGDYNKAYQWIFFGLGMAIFIIIVITSLSDWQFVGSWWWSEYAPVIITGVVIIGGIVAIILASVNSVKRESKAKPSTG